MKVLEFINNNGVLFSFIFGIISFLFSTIITSVVEKRKQRNDTVKSLQRELEETKAELEKYTSVENQEKNIDKTHAALYIETLPDGQKRNICGYCWESKRAKMPLMMEKYYSEESHRYVSRGYCFSCNANCYDE